LDRVLGEVRRKLEALGLGRREADAFVSVLRELTCVEKGELCRRPWQGRAVSLTVSKALRSGGAVLVRAPTGSGKTLYAILTGLLYQLAMGEVVELDDGRRVLVVPGVAYVVAVSEHARRYMEDYWRVVAQNVIRRVGKPSTALLSLLATLAPIPYNSHVYACPVVAMLDAEGLMEQFDDIVEKIGSGACRAEGLGKRGTNIERTWAKVVEWLATIGSGVEPWRLRASLEETEKELVKLTKEQRFIDLTEAAKKLKGGATLYLPVQAFTCPVALIRKPFPTRVLPMASIHQSLRPDPLLGLAPDHTGLNTLGRVTLQLHEANEESVELRVVRELAKLLDRDETLVVPATECEQDEEGRRLRCDIVPRLVIVDEAHRLIEPHRYSGNVTVGIYEQSLRRHLNELPETIKRVGRDRCGETRQCLEKYEEAAKSWTAWVESAVAWVNKHVARLVKLVTPGTNVDAAPEPDEPNVPALRTTVLSLAETCSAEIPSAGDLATQVRNLVELLNEWEKLRQEQQRRNGNNMRSNYLHLYKLMRRVSGRLTLASRRTGKMPRVCRALRDVLDAASLYLYNGLVAEAVAGLVEEAHRSGSFIEVGEKKYPVINVSTRNGNVDAILVLRSVSRGSVTWLRTIVADIGYVKTPEPLSYDAVVLMSGTLPRFTSRVTGDSDALYIDATALGAKRGEIRIIRLGHYVTLTRITSEPRRYVELIMRSVTGSCKPALVFMTSNDYRVLREWAEKNANSVEAARQFLDTFPEIVMSNVKRLEELLREKGAAASSLFSTLSESMEVVQDGASLIRCVVVLRLTSGDKSEHSEVARTLLARFYNVDRDTLDSVVALIRVAQVLGRSVRSERDSATAIIIDGAKQAKLMATLGRDILKEIGFTQY